MTRKPSIETAIDAKDERLGALLVTFEQPDDPTREETLLAKDIVRLDHRSLHTLPPKGKERREIRDLIVNVVTFLQEHQIAAGRALLNEVEAVYLQHLQARNRLRYLMGMLVGIAVMVLLGVGGLAVSRALENIMPAQSMLFIILFAGMGAVTSVLTRLSDIDLREQTSIHMVFISGISRPVTAVFFALVVALVLTLRIIDIHVGVTTADTVPLSLLLVAAFLCGFSERFAQDVLARVGGDALNGEGAANATKKGDRND